MLNGARLHESLSAELRGAFERVLGSGRFVGGEEVAAFETRLAKALSVGYAVGTSSGTDALVIALSALEVQPGDEVITTAYSFMATAGAIARLGAVPIFVDIDPGTFNIDTDAAAAAITERTVGILPVHLFGQCADMPSILEIASAHNVWVIEDAAQSVGATVNERFAGTMGRAGALSFFPAKNLGALGDAGAVLTNDSALVERMRALGNHGAAARYIHKYIGGNFRLDALQAAFLSVKMPHLALWQQARLTLALKYREALCNVSEISLPVETAGFGHVYNQFVIRAIHRDGLRAFMAARGIDTAVYYPVPLHLQPCFAQLGYGRGAFLQAERAALETLALPMDPYLTEGEQARIVAAIHAFYKLNK